MTASTIPSNLFIMRRAARFLMENGVEPQDSTKAIKTDAQTACFAASLLELPADFIMQVFDGAPVKECEGLVSWSLKKSGFKRVDALDSYAARRERVVSPESRKAAYQAVMISPEEKLALPCGCVPWSADRLDLIQTYCDSHYAKIERESEEMRGRARKRERVVFSPSEVAANIERLGG